MINFIYVIFHKRFINTNQNKAVQKFHTAHNTYLLAKLKSW